MGAYQSLLRPLLFRLPPERAQSLADWALRRRWLARLASAYLDYHDPRLQTTVAGIAFPSPVGLAAGYDKDCHVLDSLLGIGFGYVVGGTVLPGPRPGNPRPRLIRLPEQRALINAMGFPSQGAQAARANLERLRQRRPRLSKPVLVSVAGLAVEEFVACYTALEPLSDALELNISSPNTQGIRFFQEPDNLAALLEAINAHRAKPVFLKVPPYADDQGRERVLSLVRVARERGVDGITAANTRPVPAPALAVGQGGLSGRPLLDDTLRIVADVRAEVGPRLAIHACGGISTADDVLRALRAGADTVQLFTALVYQGPGVVRGINHGLVRLMQKRGVNSLAKLVQAQVP